MSRPLIRSKILISELVLRFYDPTKKVTIYTTWCLIYWGRCLPPPGQWPVGLFLTSINSNWADRKGVTSSHICCRTISALALWKRRWRREWSQTTGNHNPQATAECFPKNSAHASSVAKVQSKPALCPKQAPRCALLIYYPGHTRYPHFQLKTNELRKWSWK